MKISFRAHLDCVLDLSKPAVYAEFEVVGIPTNRQLDNVLAYVVGEADRWRKDRGDIRGFDYVQCCKNACKANGVEIVEKPADMIFYF